MEFLNIEENRMPFNIHTFQSQSSDIMRAFFSVRKFQTPRRQFSLEVKSDGYGASVTFDRTTDIPFPASNAAEDTNIDSNDPLDIDKFATFASPVSLMF